jgi:hypothetical protein
MSHPISLYRQIVSNDPPMKLGTLPVEPIQPLTRGNLASLSQLGRQVKDEGQFGAEPEARRPVCWKNHLGRESDRPQWTG